MAKKRKSSKSGYDSSFRQYRSDDAIERKLNSLTAAVLAMMEQGGQGPKQVFRDFGQQSALDYPSPEMFANNLQADTIMEGPITDFAEDVSGGRSALAGEVSWRAGDQFMQDVYNLLLSNLKKNARKGVR